MLIRLATHLTSTMLGNTPHRETTGYKRKWIKFMRRFPDYYRTLYQTHRQPPAEKLVQIHLEPTSGCNLKCVTCNNASSPLGKGKMSLELAYQIIDEAWDELGPEGKLGLFIRGESVLHPQLPDMIRYARSIGFCKILLSTNLMLLDASRSRKLLEAGISELRLSVDAVDAETFEATRSGSDFDRIISNLAELQQQRLALSSHCHFRLHASLHRQSLEKIPEFIRRWSYMIDQFRFTVAVNQGGLFTPEAAQKFSGLKFATATGYQIPCRILYDYVGVTYDGKLTSCCVDYKEQFIIGRIEDGIKRGFMSSAAEKIRQDHTQGNFGQLCGQCGFNNALVDWFEDEINDYVTDHKAALFEPRHDTIFRQALANMIAKFDKLADTPPVRKQDFS